MPKVSVIIPVYNVEKYLEQCIDSVINQTLKDIEIICINDGSTDNSLKILENYADKDSRIKIITQENQGLSSARNVGIKNAQGEYIGFVDSDDWIDENFIKELYAEAIRVDADIAVCGIKKCLVNKQKNLIKIKRKVITNSLKVKFSLCDIPKFNYVVNKLYKRSKILQCNLFFEEGIKYEDVLFSHKVLFYLSKTVFVPSIFYYYRISGNSITCNHSDLNINYKKQAFNNALHFVLKNNIPIKKYHRYIWDFEQNIYLLKKLILSIRKASNYYQLSLFGRYILFEKQDKIYKKERRDLLNAK